MALLTKEKLMADAHSYFASVITAGDFVVTKSSLINLFDKVVTEIAERYRFATHYPEMDGEELGGPETVEQYMEDLVMPIPYDATGANALAPHDPTSRPASYSYPIEAVNFPITIRSVEIKQALTRGRSQVVELMDRRLSGLIDALTAYRDDLKLEMVEKLSVLANDDGDDFTTLNLASAYTYNPDTVKGKYFVDGNGQGYVAMKGWTAGQYGNATLAVKDGALVPIEFVKNIAKPTDTATGEAFVKQVMNDVELAQIRNHNNLNGYFQGATPKLILYVTPGLRSIINVDTLAGAFNLSKAEIPVEMRLIEKLPIVVNSDAESSQAFALLCDSRLLKLRNAERYTDDDQRNAEGHFTNVFVYDKETPFISRSCYFKFYAEEA